MQSWQRMTRRQWLSGAGLMGASLASSRLLGMVVPRDSSPLKAAQPGTVVPDKSLPRVRPFPMTQVRLRPGIFQQQQEHNRAYLHLLPNVAYRQHS